jgi:hypothetical protein
MGAVIINRLGPQLLCGVIFVTYAAASIIWTSGDKSLASLWLMTLVGAFIFGYRSRSIRGVWFGATILFLTITFAGQFIGAEINPNYIGISLACALAAMIAYEYWLTLPILLFEIWLTQSRTALLGAGVACLIGLWQRSRFWAMVLALLAILFILHQKSDGALSLWSRLGIWQDTINNFTPFGHGFGSFFAEYSTWAVRRNMTLQLAPHAYNDIAELIFELGVGVVALWALIFLAWENHNPQAKLICGVFFIMGLTHFPLFIPLIAHLFAMTLGHLSTSTTNTQKNRSNTL